MSAAVWDASALLLLLQREAGWREMAARLPDAAISAVNLSEVAAKLIDAGGAPGKTREVLDQLPLEVHDFTRELAFRAAELRPTTRARGLSLGDRACLALGLLLDLPVLTGDRVWLGLDLGVEVELVRPK